MPVNDTTTNRGYQKPNIANTLADDVGRLRSALDAIDTDMASKAPTAGPTFTGVTTIAAGTAAAPSLTFTGATSDTGFYSPGTDQVAISTGGTGRLVVEADGTVRNYTATNFEIYRFSGGPGCNLNYAPGTQGSPAAVSAPSILGAFRFNAYDGSAYYSVSELRSGSDGAISNTSSPGYFYILTTPAGSTAGQERIRVTSDGKVGIGTSAPSSKLYVSETSTIAPSLTYGATSAFTFLGGNVELAGGLSGTSPFPYWLQARDSTNAARALVINPLGGNVGIGTTGPGAALEINAAASTSPAIFKINTSEVGRWDSSGRLLVGTSTARSTQFFQMEGPGYEGSSSRYTRYSNDALSGGVILAKTRGTTAGSNTIVAADDRLGRVEFQGTDGAGLITAANIDCFVDGTPGTNSMPGRIVLGTTASGASTPTEQWRINNAGTVIYNQPAPAAVDTSATLTVANLTAKIITSTTAAAVTMTLPTGTNMDAGFSGLYTNMAFEWYVINTGGTNAVTVAANTAHTIVGSGTVSANNSGKFLSRRTAATTWVTYRLSS